MKKPISFLLLLMVCGCQNFLNSGNQAKQNPNDCPNKPTAILDNQSVKPIALNEQVIYETSIVNQNKFVGYTFQGQAGERLNYQTNQNICVWVYTPERQLLSDPILPTTGRYTIQVSALKGSTTFELKMSLGNTTVFSSEPKR